jgi:hypothetical protein
MFLINGGEYWQAKEVKNKGNQRGVHTERQNGRAEEKGLGSTTEYIGVEMK